MEEKFEQHFLSGLPRLSLLSAQEERELFLRLRAGDEAAREELVLRNTGLVYSLAQKRLGSRLKEGGSYSELVDIGFEALLIAIDRYDCDHPSAARFATFAYPRIDGAIKRKIDRLLKLEAHEEAVAPVRDEDTAGLSLLELLPEGFELASPEEYIALKSLVETMIRNAQLPEKQEYVFRRRRGLLENEPDKQRLQEIADSMKPPITRQAVYKLDKKAVQNLNRSLGMDYREYLKKELEGTSG